MSFRGQVDFLEPDRSRRASRQGRALPRPGLPDRRHLEDAARLLDEQGADPDQGQEAADLRHGRGRDRDADQAGQGQGPEPRRGDRRGAALPRESRAALRLSDSRGRTGAGRADGRPVERLGSRFGRNARDDVDRRREDDRRRRATSRSRAASAGSEAAARSGAPRSRPPRPSAAPRPGTRPRR